MKKKTNSVQKGVKLAALGAGIAAIAATTYFFFGPKGKMHQKHAKAWVIKMKGDIVEKLENAKDITEDVYHDIINAVAKDYSRDSRIIKAELNSLVQDLKKHWKTISRSAKGTAKEFKKEVVKTVKMAKSAK